jgi:hypothetical protein
MGSSLSAFICVKPRFIFNAALAALGLSRDRTQWPVFTDMVTCLVYEGLA